MSESLLKNLRRQQQLLLSHTIVDISAAPGFIAAEQYLTEKANIGHMNNDFKNVFLTQEEKDIPAGILGISTLQEASADERIIRLLGDKAEISLAHLIDMISRQAHGQLGDLIIDAICHVAYIRDRNSRLWAACFYWQDAVCYWQLNAHLTKSRGTWAAGTQIISRL